MCGICGILDRHGSLSRIFEMNQTQRHRGPDDEGYAFINTAGGAVVSLAGPDSPRELALPAHRDVAPDGADLALGNRRLAIVDVSPGGHMPMSAQGGQVWITYNGEIYNYVELRETLKTLGHTFSTDSDTEVILAAYAQWGADCLPHFNGMFAFALWDGPRHRLFCARDRFGVKPFYYWWNSGRFVFASETKSLLKHPSVPCLPNDQSVFDFLSAGITDHNDQTFFSGVNSLVAGHTLTLDVVSMQLETCQWWDFEINPELRSRSEAASRANAERFAELLGDAIRLRLRSDVPIGSCLSGGLDSSTIVCLANRYMFDESVVSRRLIGDRQKTFTAAYAEPEFDERSWSQLVIRKTGAEENLVFPTAQGLWSEIETMAWHMDEPVGSTSIFAQWNVMRLARQRGVTVLLDGQGGDELLGGYFSYFPHYLSQVRQQAGAPAMIQAAWQLSRVGGSPVVQLLLQSATYRLPWRLQRTLRRRTFETGSGVQGWQFSEDFLRRFADRAWKPPSAVDATGLAGILYRDVTTTNLPKLLRYEDRNSMAFSVESRLPFLDYRLVQWVFSLPLDERIRNGWSKWIMRASLGGVLPEEIRWRRTKLGFATPEQRWFREGAGHIRSWLAHGDTELVAPYIRSGVLRQLCEMSDDALVAAPGVWRLVNLIVWLKLFIGSGAPVGR